MTLHVCEDGYMWFVQEDPEAEEWIASFHNEAQAEEYKALIEAKAADRLKWSEKTSVFDVLKFFDMEDKYDTMNKVDKMFYDWDGFSCGICGDTIPVDGKEMILHMTQHTIEEIKEFKK